MEMKWKILFFIFTTASCFGEETAEMDQIDTDVSFNTMNNADNPHQSDPIPTTMIAIWKDDTSWKTEVTKEHTEEDATLTTSIATADPSTMRPETTAKRFLEAAYQTLPYKVGQVMYTYVVTSMCAVGVFTNLLAVVVFLKSSKSGNSVNVYLTILSVFDGILLLTSFVKITLTVSSLKDTSIGCKLFDYVTMLSGAGSNLLIAALTIERVLVTKYPLKALTWFSRKRARIISFAVFILVSACSSQVLYYVKLDFNGQCTTFNNIADNTILQHILLLRVMAIRLIIPICTMITANSIMLVSLKGNRQLSGVSDGTDQSNRDRIAEKANMSATRIVLAISFTFLTCHAILILCAFVLPGVIDQSVNPLYFGIVYLAERVAMFFKYFNSAANFWLYCVYGAKFRGELRKAVCCKK